MCACEWNFTCARHREQNPDLPDGDDEYDAEKPAVPEQERNSDRPNI